MIDRLTHKRPIRLGLATVAAVLGATLLAAPADAQRQYNRARSRAPDGPWLGGGLNVSGGGGPDGAGVRLEFGLPLKVAGAGQLSLALPLSTYHDGRPGDARVNVVQFVPEVQWEYVFPIDMNPRLGLSPLFGFGIGGLWVGNNNNDDDGAFLLTWRLGAVLRLGFESGAYLGMQPFAVTLNAAFDAPGDDFFANYEWYFLAGYRWE